MIQNVDVNLTDVHSVTRSLGRNMSVNQQSNLSLLLITKRIVLQLPFCSINVFLLWYIFAVIELYKLKRRKVCGVFRFVLN